MSPRARRHSPLRAPTRRTGKPVAGKLSALRVRPVRPRSHPYPIPRRPNTWLHRAQARLCVLRMELDATYPPPDRPARDGVRFAVLQTGADCLLDSAQNLIKEAGERRSWLWRLRSWWSGHSYEGTLACLHAADVAVLAMSRPRRAWQRLDTILVTARPLRRGDPRLARVRALKSKQNPDDECLPWALAALLQAAYALQEERAVRSRNFRNRLIRAGSVLCLLLAAALVAPLWVDGAVPVCEAGRNCPDSLAPGVREVGVVMLLGVLGAALHVAARLQQMGGSWNPYGLPLFQELIKLPTGALTAVTGLVLVDTAALPVIQAPDAWRGVMTYAVVFGVAQLALTRTIDQRAEKLLAAEPAPDEVKQLEKAPEDHQDII
ncbi:hypothetical protein GCM10022403_047640 [Streptomyces coacervatus]|uniref:Uncharacterized protein n=1 Tax=Streptomyces coacervatus TaxID=647381 RepID=A0ABP7I2A6_9ACTN|nr:hypothetical protein [Streptomyces coacervatus]MDF2266377.1 hypothetical protein [Streptomyces coacervatus]